MKFYQLWPAEIFFEYKIHKTILTIPFLKLSFDFKYFIDCCWDKKDHFNRFCKWIYIVETYQFHIVETCPSNPTLFSINIAEQNGTARIMVDLCHQRRISGSGMILSYIKYNCGVQGKEAHCQESQEAQGRQAKKCCQEACFQYACDHEDFCQEACQEGLSQEEANFFHLHNPPKQIAFFRANVLFT